MNQQPSRTSNAELLRMRAALDRLLLNDEIESAQAARRRTERALLLRNDAAQSSAEAVEEARMIEAALSEAREKRRREVEEARAAAAAAAPAAAAAAEEEADEEYEEGEEDDDEESGVFSSGNFVKVSSGRQSHAPSRPGSGPVSTLATRAGTSAGLPSALKPSGSGTIGGGGGKRKHSLQLVEDLHEELRTLERQAAVAALSSPARAPSFASGGGGGRNAMSGRNTHGGVPRVSSIVIVPASPLTGKERPGSPSVTLQPAARSRVRLAPIETTAAGQGASTEAAARASPPSLALAPQGVSFTGPGANSKAASTRRAAPSSRRLLSVIRSSAALGARGRSGVGGRPRSPSSAVSGGDLLRFVSLRDEAAASLARTNRNASRHAQELELARAAAAAAEEAERRYQAMRRALRVEVLLETFGPGYFSADAGGDYGAVRAAQIDLIPEIDFIGQDESAEPQFAALADPALSLDDICAAFEGTPMWEAFEARASPLAELNEAEASSIVAAAEAFIASTTGTPLNSRKAHRAAASAAAAFPERSDVDAETLVSVLVTETTMAPMRGDYDDDEAERAREAGPPPSHDPMLAAALEELATLELLESHRAAERQAAAERLNNATPRLCVVDRAQSPRALPPPTPDASQPLLVRHSTAAELRRLDAAAAADARRTAAPTQFAPAAAEVAEQSVLDSDFAQHDDECIENSQIQQLPVAREDAAADAATSTLEARAKKSLQRLTRLRERAAFL